MLKIKKSDLADIRVSPSWLTNGHWAIRRDIAEAHAKPLFAEHILDPYREMEDKTLETVVGTKEKYPYLYEATGEIRNLSSDLDPRGDTVLFANAHNTEPLGIDRKYVRMFQLTNKELFGKDKTSAVAVLDDAGKPWLVVMPKEVTP